MIRKSMFAALFVLIMLLGAAPMFQQSSHEMMKTSL